MQADICRSNKQYRDACVSASCKKPSAEVQLTVCAASVFGASVCVLVLQCFLAVLHCFLLLLTWQALKAASGESILS
jgi:hypothetical protein